MLRNKFESAFGGEGIYKTLRGVPSFNGEGSVTSGSEALIRASSSQLSLNINRTFRVALMFVNHNAGIVP